MEKINSFKLNHKTLLPGIYISSISNDITTYDLRLKKPNTSQLSTASIHSFEHLLATVLRNGNIKNNIVYVGPMGCRTGFYILTVNLNCDIFLENLKKALLFIINDCAEMYGKSEEECGFYKDLSLEKGKKTAALAYKIVKDKKVITNYQKI